MCNDNLVSSIYKLVPDTERTKLLLNLKYPREASHNADVPNKVHFGLASCKPNEEVCLASFLNYA